MRTQRGQACATHLYEPGWRGTKREPHRLARNTPAPSLLKTGLLISFLLAGTLAGVRPCAAARIGDVDGDNAVTQKDAVQILQRIMGLSRPTGRENILADAWPVGGTPTTQAHHWSPGDGVINVPDVIEVLRAAAGLTPVRDIGPIVYDVAGSGPYRRVLPKDVLRTNPQKADDGPALEIYLFDPWDLALAPNGDVYFTEYYGERVRVLKPDGTVRTVAGSFDAPGYVDGRATRARFRSPEGIALLPDGSLVVADMNNSVVRKIAPDGSVTTLAGAGRSDFRDGVGKAAAFDQPNGVCTDPAGNVYVADTFNNRIRKIAPDGTVTTVAGSGIFGYANGTALSAQLAYPTGDIFEPRDGTLYHSDLATVRPLNPGYLETLAGSAPPGYREGAGLNAGFHAP
ncbi:MAG: SMP-30/gluconolactonase/LRE family protein, partial [Armatimonadetes bacterium]|nr:SMP-30/gluconolactonase/LRE family protein [Armatimonadota bacterium]